MVRHGAVWRGCGVEWHPCDGKGKVAFFNNDLGVRSRSHARPVNVTVGVSRFVTLPHTEGCGHTSGSQEALVVRTMVGYAVHPLVTHCVLLEHGCEKTHNGRLEEELTMAVRIRNIKCSANSFCLARNIFAFSPRSWSFVYSVLQAPQSLFGQGATMDRYRFASVQLDGGLQQVADKVEAQFRELHASLLTRMQPPMRVPARMSELRIGIMADGPVDESLQRAVGLVSQAICSQGGTVVLAGSLRSGRVLQVRVR